MANCDTVVTDAERQVMERTRQLDWYNGGAVEQEKERLLNEAKSGCQLRFVCFEVERKSMTTEILMSVPHF